jgi:AcrR family transcriptional regulator
MSSNTRKDQIVTQAAALFLEKGYSAVTMRDLAKQMGIKAASLYNHIASKHEILETLIITVAEQFSVGMGAIVKSQDDTLSKIEAIINLHIDVTLNNQDALGSLNNDWMHLEGKALIYFEKMRNGYEDDFRKIIKQGIVQGVIANRNPEILLFSVLSTLRTLYLWYPKKGDIDVKTLKEDMRQTLLASIKA